MRTVNFCVRGLACCVIFAFNSVTGTRAEEPSRFLSADEHPVGVVMGISGGSVSMVSPGSVSRTVKVGDLMAAGEEVSAGPGTKIDVLWDHRALLTLHEGARVQIDEPHHGQTELRLYGGTVRIALSYDAGRMTDKLILQTALARVVSRGGILEATVMGGEQRSFLARLVNAPAVETVRVFEGQARVEPLTGEGKPFSLKTGSEVILKPGVFISISDIPSSATSSVQPLAVRAEHRQPPQPVTRQIVTAHVDLALEVEKELRRNPAVNAEKDQPGATAKGAILPTTTGVPSFPGVQAFAGGGGSIGTPSNTSSSPILPPPVASSIQAAVAGAGPAQSGGLNSNGLLKQILNEVGKGSKGQGKK